MRDGGVCVLCGDDPIDVAHIVTQETGDVGQVNEIGFTFYGVTILTLVRRFHLSVAYPHR